MENQLNIAFFGTSDRSNPILETLHKNFNLALCVTKADTKVGRKQEIRETQVKTWTRTNQIPCITINNIKVDQETIINTLKQHKIDLAIVADFSFLLPQAIIDTPKYKMINIHFSLLPKYRGASPVQFAILNGDKVTGVTYYLMAKGMDTGDIIFQFKHELTAKEISGELYNILFKKAAEKLPDVINNLISGKLSPTPQDNNQATYCWSKTNSKTTFILKDDAKIDWELSAAEIERLVRAYHPWPIAWTTLEDLENAGKTRLVNSFTIKNNVDKKVKIFATELVDGEKLQIIELQVEGKNKTDWKSFLNGYAVV